MEVKRAKNESSQFQLPLTDREKSCIVYGYVWRIAEEAKERGLFKDLSIKDVIQIFFESHSEKK